VIHQYIDNYLFHSKQAGERGRGNWKSIDVVIEGINPQPPVLMYAPFTLDQQNSQNITFGSDRIFLDNNQGLGKWKTQSGAENSIKLPFLDKVVNVKLRELV